MSEEFDGSMTLRSPGKESIRQFVIYAENKVGWLNDFITMLQEVDIHILAISVLDTTDSAVIRVVPNYPKDLARLLKSQSISFTERTILAIEVDNEDSIKNARRFVMAGRTWEIVDADPEQEELLVGPVRESGSAPVWAGELPPVPRKIAEEVGHLRKITAQSLGFMDKKMNKDPRSGRKIIVDKIGKFI